MFKTASLFLLLAVVGVSMAQNYCDLCKDHTMCMYGTQGQKCGSIIRSGLSNAERDEVVAAHNELRARVAAGLESAGSNGGQPTAANMRKMVWDNELATVAQRWANQCNFGHDACRKVSRFGVGQNAYMTSTTGSAGGADWRGAVKGWYNEVKDFNKDNIAPFKYTSQPVIGHYTQVAWAESSHVGCGFTQFPDGEWKRSLYICNYGPGGNVVGMDIPMYKLGRTCSQCPQGTTCQGSLCA